MSERHTVWRQLDKMQMDIRDLAARMVELRATVAGLQLPEGEKPECPVCGLVFSKRLWMETHWYQAHDGPIPSSDQAAERLAG